MATKMIDELETAYMSFCAYTVIMELVQKKSQGRKFELGNGC